MDERNNHILVVEAMHRPVMESRDYTMTYGGISNRQEIRKYSYVFAYRLYSTHIGINTIKAREHSNDVRIIADQVSSRLSYLFSIEQYAERKIVNTDQLGILIRDELSDAIFLLNARISFKQKYGYTPHFI